MVYSYLSCCPKKVTLIRVMVSVLRMDNHDGRPRPGVNSDVTVKQS